MSLHISIYNYIQLATPNPATALDCVLGVAWQGAGAQCSLSSRYSAYKIVF